MKKVAQQGWIMGLCGHLEDQCQFFGHELTPDDHVCGMTCQVASDCHEEADCQEWAQGKAEGVKRIGQTQAEHALHLQEEQYWC